MIDLRPIGYVIGLLIACLGGTMLLPLAADLWYRNGHYGAFAESALFTVLAGGAMAIASANGAGGRLTIQQTFLVTSLVWLALPVFGTIPLILGATEARAVDAFFESMSGFTTTGSTVLTGLDDLPEGLLLWRAMLQWFGGIGIVVVAMAFLPELRVGGMQIFKSEAFDTFGKILPKAGEIAKRISVIYIGLTVACAIAYGLTGMSGFDAICHAMTTLSTGGFANYDASFAAFSAGAHYVAALFMLASALPYIRYIQVVQGDALALVRDDQVRAVVAFCLIVTVVLTAYVWLDGDEVGEEGFREALFNSVSVITGTGYASADYMLWGPFAVVVFFFIGLVGGAAGSTSCSIKIFRYQILFSAIRAQVQAIHSPHGIFHARFQGRRVSDEVLSSVMAFFVVFTVSLGILAVLLSATGLDFITSVSGAATAIANIGPGLGDRIGPAGNFSTLNDTAKWLLIGGMYVGRLELLSVFVIFTVRFWQA